LQTGTAPTSIVAGDFNGDGKVDLAVTNSKDNSVSVFLGNGDGTFQTGVTYAVGSDPLGIAVGDFNNDGKLDLATANHDSNNVSLLYGKGDGTFQIAPGTLAVGSAPIAIVSGDFNGDGRTDLATANADSQSVSVILGSAPGVFLPHLDYSANGAPLSLTKADVNGDGVTDLVVGKDNAVGVMLGNGNGTFGAIQDTTVATGSYYVATGDFNGDGKLDVAITNYQRDTLSILLGKGDGTFQTPMTVDGGAVPSGVIVGDFNGDGNADLAVANDSSTTAPGGVRLLFGNGKGAFQTTTDFATGAGPIAVAWADVNGDGKLDLITANSAAGTVSVLLGNGDGTFQAPVNYLAGVGPDSIQVGDFNGDGHLDIAVTDGGSSSAQGHTVAVLLGNGNGTFQAPSFFNVGMGPAGLAVGDFNGDGKLDIATANMASNTVSILLGNGDGTFQTAKSALAGVNPSAIAVGDFNGDGNLDLAVTDENLQGGAGQVSVLWGRGDGTFRSPMNFFVGAMPTAVVVADVNGDGAPDLIVADSGGLPGSNSGDVSVLLNRGTGTFLAAQHYATNTGTHSVTVADVNGDGKPDIVTADPGADTVSVLLGNGNGVFSAPVSFGVGAHPRFVAAADFNGDGGTDLVTANTGSATFPGQNVSVLLNTQEVASQFEFATATWNAAQSDASITIVVTRTGNLNQSASVQYATSDGTATAGQDYLATEGILHFAPGEITKTFKISLLDDHTVGGANETVQLTLSNPTGGTTLGNPSTSVINIRNVHPPSPGTLHFSAGIYQVNENDGTAVITVTRTGGSDGEVSVHYSTLNGSAVPGQNYTPVSGTLTFESGETSKTFTISLIDDGIFHHDRTIQLELDHPTNGARLSTNRATVMIHETDPFQHCTLQFSASAYSVNETDGTAEITVTRTGDSNGIVTVNYVAFDGTAKAGADYARSRGTLTFAAGETSKTIEIPIFDDHRVEHTESFHIALSNPVGGATLGTTAHAAVNILDNDSALQFSVGKYTVNQSAGTVTLTVNRLDSSSGTVTVHYATSDGSALAGTDYVAAEGDLTFNDGETSKTITITIDTASHPHQASESFFVTLSSPGGESALGTPRKATVVIHNQ
jgi:hypothetical protein